MSNRGEPAWETLAAATESLVKNADATAMTRKALLAAAIDLLARPDGATTSIREIVNHAGVTKGAFYHHFESKAHLIEAVHDQLLATILEELRRIAAQTHDPRQRLEELIVAIFCNNVRHRAHVRIFFREYSVLPDDIMRGVQAQRDEYEALIVRVIDDGIANGQFTSELSSTVVAFGIIGMCAWSTYWFDADGPLSPEQVARGYAVMITDGLARTAGT